MLAPVVFENVSLKFRRGERHGSLRDLIPDLVRGAVRHKRPDELAREEFWVLREVSFEVRAQQILGIIGPNGAGKSTILKLVAGILRPTLGRVRVAGRVGALIELAAGFHTELSGRENIYLQGAIMGMRRAEIARKFNRIVDFAGVSDFIDTPLKRYSSGMSARLGFAIAAHLDPDVLLVDEVLAVGDLEFQQRAIQRLEEIVLRDIPVIIVSHELDRVTRLCSHALLLEKGKVVVSGSPEECAAIYRRRYGQGSTSEGDGTGGPATQNRSVEGDC